MQSECVHVGLCPRVSLCHGELCVYEMYVQVSLLSLYELACGCAVPVRMCVWVCNDTYVSMPVHLWVLCIYMCTRACAPVLMAVHVYSCPQVCGCPYLCGADLSGVC